MDDDQTNNSELISNLAARSNISPDWVEGWIRKDLLGKYTVLGAPIPKWEGLSLFRKEARLKRLGFTQVLMPCSICGRGVSTAARSCPQCGHQDLSAAGGDYSREYFRMSCAADLLVSNLKEDFSKEQAALNDRRSVAAQKESIRVDSKGKEIAAPILGDAPIVVGQIVHGRVTRIEPFGCFVEYAKGKEGVCHISEVAEERVRSVEEVVKLGEGIFVKCQSIDSKSGRPRLSRRAALRDIAAKKAGS